MNRAPRAVSVAIIATVSITLTLSACAGTSGTDNHLAELRAAQNSDLLSVPSEQVYKLDGFDVTAPKALAALNGVAQSQLDYSGFIVLSDDIITEAEFDFDIASLQHAHFVLTEPAALRRAETESGPTYAIGEITVGDQLPSPAMVKFTPASDSDESVEFDININLPNELTYTQDGFLAEEITARIALTPMP